VVVLWEVEVTKDKDVSDLLFVLFSLRLDLLRYHVQTLLLGLGCVVV